MNYNDDNPDDYFCWIMDNNKNVRIGKKTFLQAILAKKCPNTFLKQQNNN